RSRAAAHRWQSRRPVSLGVEPFDGAKWSELGEAAGSAFEGVAEPGAVAQSRREYNGELEERERVLQRARRKGRRSLAARVGRAFGSRNGREVARPSGE